MHSRFFENTIAELIALTGEESELKVRRAIQNSKMLSSDVSAAYDPMFAAAFEKRSSAFFGKGLVFNKFTGSRGKNGSNDANAEYLAEIRNVMDEAEVGYQFAELGKVDVGGGGTIAYIMAQYGMEVKQGLGQADAEARAAAVVPRPGCNEAGTGLAADILAEGYTRLDTGFADTDAYRWLCAYAADYGFILRWPEDSQAVTGMVFQPWHWRYVGVENARAIRASGQCLEAFLALRRADLS